MPIFVCNFCGGDHGANDCSEMVQYQFEEDFASEVLCRMFDFLGHTLSSAQWEEVEENYDSDQPIEQLAYIVEHFSDSFNDDEIKKYFAPVKKNDGKIYNASRKFGSCFEFAFKTLLDDAAEELDDGEVFLVHGYVLTNSTDHICHAWLETDNHVINCGSMQKEFKVFDIDEFYLNAKVTNPERFSRKEALAKVNKLNHYGSWCADPPDSIKMSDEWIEASKK